MFQLRLHFRAVNYPVIKATFSKKAYTSSLRNKTHKAYIKIRVTAVLKQIQYIKILRLLVLFENIKKNNKKACLLEGSLF